MNTRKLLSLLAFFLGETLIVSAFLLWKEEETPGNIVTLNLLVTTVVYCLFFVDIVKPWINLTDKSSKQAGSIGIRWFSTWMYAIAAAITMLLCNLYFDTEFKVQLIIHGTLLFFLILSFAGVLCTSDKTQDIYQKETMERNGINDMKKSIIKLKEASISACSSLPEEVTHRIKNLEEELRYLSPSNSPDAFSLETKFVKTIENIIVAIHNYEMNQEHVSTALRQAECIFQSRKSIYSN